MSVDTSTMQQHSSLSNWAANHEPLVIGGAVVAVLVLAGLFANSRNKQLPASNSTGQADLSGLQNGNLVYVPTSTNFTTENYKEQNINSNDPNLTSISGTQTITGTTTTINKPVTINPIKPPVTPIPTPIRKPPVPTPLPPTRGKGLIWDQRHTITGGETLSIIAIAVTRSLRQQGMPGSMSITWHDLYAHNTNIINQYSQRYGMPIKGSWGTNDPAGPWNNVFPGETITIPRWG